MVLEGQWCTGDYITVQGSVNINGLLICNSCSWPVYQIYAGISVSFNRNYRKCIQTKL